MLPDNLQHNDKGHIMLPLNPTGLYYNIKLPDSPVYRYPKDAFVIIPHTGDIGVIMENCDTDQPLLVKWENQDEVATVTDLSSIRLLSEFAREHPGQLVYYNSMKQTCEEELSRIKAQIISNLNTLKATCEVVNVMGQSDLLHFESSIYDCKQLFKNYQCVQANWQLASKRIIQFTT